GVDWATGNSVVAADLNADFNTIYNEFDGLISNANISPAAAIVWSKLLTAGQIANVDVAATALIDPEKIDDQANVEFEFQGATDPGETGASILPTSLQGELRALRFVLRAGLLGANTKRISEGTAVGWYDAYVRGGNLIFNGSFGVWNSSTPTVGDGWVASGGASTTVSLTALGAGDETEGLGSCLRIVDGTGGRGIEQSLSGLKASTKYLISVRVRPSVNQVRLTTTGAAAGSFTNLAVNSASGSGTWETLSGLIQTDATGSAIVVRLRGVAAASDWKCTHFRVQPAEDDPIGTPTSVIDYDTSADNGNAGPLTVSSLDAIVKVPSSGYIIIVLSRVTGRQPGGAGSDGSATVILRENGATVATSINGISQGGATSNAQEYVCFHVNLNPTPGTTFTYDCTFTGAGVAPLVTNGANAPHQIFALALKL
ncbi:MAG: hypothetical protein ACRD2L_13950, partial [Terriglobia bacterium]